MTENDASPPATWRLVEAEGHEALGRISSADTHVEIRACEIPSLEGIQHVRGLRELKVVASRIDVLPDLALFPALRTVTFIGVSPFDPAPLMQTHADCAVTLRGVPLRRRDQALSALVQRNAAKVTVSPGDAGVCREAWLRQRVCYDEIDREKAVLIRPGRFGADERARVIPSAIVAGLFGRAPVPDDQFWAEVAAQALPSTDPLAELQASGSRRLQGSGLMDILSQQPASEAISAVARFARRFPSLDFAAPDAAEYATWRAQHSWLKDPHCMARAQWLHERSHRSYACRFREGTGIEGWWTMAFRGAWQGPDPRPAKASLLFGTAIRSEDEQGLAIDQSSGEVLIVDLSEHGPGLPLQEPRLRSTSLASEHLLDAIEQIRRSDGTLLAPQ